jgi:hypothetical protein
MMNVMKRFLELIGALLLFQGVAGVVNGLVGWWRWSHDLLLVNHLDFFTGYEVVASGAFAMVGLALYAVGSADRRSHATR